MALPESCVRDSSRTPLFPGLSFLSRPGEYGRRPVAWRRPMQPDRPPLPPGAGRRSHPSTTGHPDRVPSGEGEVAPGPIRRIPWSRNVLLEPDRRTGHRCVLRDPPSGPDPPAPHRHRHPHAPPSPDRQLYVPRSPRQFGHARIRHCSITWPVTRPPDRPIRSTCPTEEQERRHIDV